MVTEDYVSFETAKLLKEKGFDEPCLMCYTYDGKLGNYGQYNSYKNSEVFSLTAPTLQMAMKWLRIAHGLFIRVTEDITGNVFEWSIYQKSYGCRMSTRVEDSYEKACETAIRHCLENLI